MITLNSYVLRNAVDELEKSSGDSLKDELFEILLPDFRSQLRGLNLWRWLRRRPALNFDSLDEQTFERFFENMRPSTRNALWKTIAEYQEKQERLDALRKISETREIHLDLREWLEIENQRLLVPAPPTAS